MSGPRGGRPDPDDPTAEQREPDATPSGADVSAVDLGPNALHTARSLLLELGCTDDELDEAERQGTLPLLAVERLMVADEARYDLESVAEQTGLGVDPVRTLWRMLGYPVPRPGEAAFTEIDVEILREIGRLVAEDVTSARLVMQMSRVIGSAMARVASAQVDVLAARSVAAPGAGPTVDDELSDERIVVSARALLPIVPTVLTASWRRHLQGAIRRRLSIAEAGTGQLGVVGFADLVGFTALSQEVADDELASIVDRFEHLAFDVVTAHGGRVVKMIGDEVMFTVDTPVAAAEIGLALAEHARGADELSDLRVGMAYGPLLERESDLYGAVVNLASRITAIAFPGTIVVGRSMHEHLVDDGRYRLRSMRPRHLKDFGRVPLWVLRRSGQRDGPPAEARSGGGRRADRRPPRRGARRGRDDGDRQGDRGAAAGRAASPGQTGTSSAAVSPLDADPDIVASWSTAASSLNTLSVSSEMPARFVTLCP
jgi:adenylate cyclase